MKQDIRDLFNHNQLPKKKLPESHREEFLGKLQTIPAKNSSKKNLFLSFRVAASVAALVALFFLLKKEDTISAPIKTNIVATPVDSIFTNTKHIVEYTKTTIAKEDITQFKTLSNTKEETKIALNDLLKKRTVVATINVEKKLSPKITQTVDSTINTVLIAHKIQENSIKVNSSALLYSITHSRNEVLAYYKENNLLRPSVLASIEEDLKKHHLNVDANVLLKEIEYGIGRNSFKEKLLEAIKQKINKLSTAIASN